MNVGASDVETRAAAERGGSRLPAGGPGQTAAAEARLPSFLTAALASSHLRAMTSSSSLEELLQIGRY